MKERRRSGAAVTTVAVALTGALPLLGVVGAHALAREDTGPQVVQLAGMQRTLTVLAATHASRVVSATDPAEARAAQLALADTIDELVRNHRALLDGDPRRGADGELTPELEALYAGPDGLDAAVRSFVADGRTIVTTPTDRLDTVVAVQERMQGQAAGTLFTGLHRATNLFLERQLARHRANATLGAVLPSAGFALALVVLVATILVRRSRHQLDQRRRAEAEILAGLIQASASPVSLTDADGRFRLVNPAFTTLLGWAPEQVIGRSVLDLIPPEDRPGFLEGRHRDAAVGTPVERRYLTSTGEELTVLETLAVVGNGGGAGSYVAQMQDISERKRTERLLAENEARFRAVVEALPDPTFRISREGCYLDAHLPGASNPGRTKDDIVGRRLADVLPGELAATVTEHVRQSLDAHRLVTFEYELEWSTGEAHWYQGRIVPSGNDEVVLIARDVTDERAAREAVRVSEERYRAFFERSAAPIALSSVTGRLLAANRAMAALIGVDGEQVMGMSVNELIHPDDVELAIAEGARLVNGELVASEFECRLRCADGSACWVWVAATALRDEIGRPVGILAQFFDITARKEAQQALATSEARSRALVRALPDVMLRIDRSGVLREFHVPRDFVRSAPEARSRLEEGLGRPLTEVVTYSPEDVAALLGAVDAAILSGQPISVELRFAHPDGGLGTREARVVRVDDEEAVVILRDVSEARRAAEQVARSELLFRTLADASPVAIFQMTPAWDVTYMNDRWAEITGQPASSASGSGWLEPIASEDRPEVLAAMHHATSGTVDTRMRFRVHRPDGEQRWLDARMAPSRDADGEVTGFVGTAADITETVELMAETDRLAGVLQASPDYVVITDPTGAVLFANHSAQLVVPDGGNLVDALTEESQIRYRDEALPAVDRVGFWSGELALRLGEQIVLPVSALVTSHRDGRGELAHLSTVARDISELKDAQDRLKHLATHDPLTGLPNRTLFMDRLERALRRSQRSGAPLAVLFCDLDGFKAVNDRFGHEGGDALLRVVSARVEACIRGSDTAARFGGDEFVVLCESLTDPEDALVVGRRLIAAITEPVAMADGTQVQVGTSVGVAFTNGGTAADVVVSNADLAMYRAKSEGKGRLCVYADALRA